MNKIFTVKAFRVIMAVLTVILFINALTLFNSIRHSHFRYVNEYSDFQRAMDEEDYPELRHMLENNDINGVKSKEDLSEFREAAKNYEKEMLE